MKSIKKRTRIIGSILLFLLVLTAAIYSIRFFYFPEPEVDKTMQGMTATEQELANQLESDVRELSIGIGERNMHTPGTMDRAADWIENRLMESGYNPERHSYEIDGYWYGGESADNLIAEVPGTDQPDKIVVVGAHYDTVSGSPGANDNASAVAALLELADWFRDRPQSKTVRFVFFANEEPPFFHTRNMGSYAYAADARDAGDDISAMMALDGLGYYSDEPRTQSYPVPGIGFIYPKTADFIGFVTRVRDSGLLRRALKAFRQEATINAEGAALPGFIPGVYWSDHWSFWKHDFPAFLVTDTLIFRDPQYHSPGDTPERLDYNRMARVTEGLKRVVEKL